MPRGIWGRCPAEFSVRPRRRGADRELGLRQPWGIPRDAPAVRFAGRRPWRRVLPAREPGEFMRPPGTEWRLRPRIGKRSAHPHRQRRTLGTPGAVSYTTLTLP